jgi:hypothetical protein
VVAGVASVAVAVIVSHDGTGTVVAVRRFGQNRRRDERHDKRTGANNNLQHGEDPFSTARKVNTILTITIRGSP